MDVTSEYCLEQFEDQKDQKDCMDFANEAVMRNKIINKNNLDECRFNLKILKNQLVCGYEIIKQIAIENSNSQLCGMLQGYIWLLEISVTGEQKQVITGNHVVRCIGEVEDDKNKDI